MEALERGGADLIELGVPFSDPDRRWTGDPARGRARAAAGTTLKKCWKSRAKIREQSEIPLLLFTYLNPVMRYGLDKSGAGCGGMRASMAAC